MASKTQIRSSIYDDSKSTLFAGALTLALLGCLLLGVL
jgi:hypothetical protein